VERIDRDRDNLNPDLQVMGMVPTRYRASLALHQQRIEDMKKLVGADGRSDAGVEDGATGAVGADQARASRVMRWFQRCWLIAAMPL
jgi:cellulose biosynthesis protein BcsQ